MHSSARLESTRIWKNIFWKFTNIVFGKFGIFESPRTSKFKSWVVRRLASLQQGWGEFTRAIGDCYITDMNQVVGSGE